MKFIVLNLAFALSLPAFAARHPVAQYTHDTLTDVVKVMERKNEGERLRGVCAIFKSNIHSPIVAGNLLKDFSGLDRDQAAINEFVRMVPGIVLGKGLSLLGGSDDFSATFTVKDNVREMGNGYYRVGLTINNNGKNMNGEAVIYFDGNDYYVVDAKYLGISAIGFVAGDYQKILRREYNKNPNGSMPVTALVQHVKAQSDYINCN